MIFGSKNGKDFVFKIKEKITREKKKTKIKKCSLMKHQLNNFVAEKKQQNVYLLPLEFTSNVLVVNKSSPNDHALKAPHLNQRLDVHILRFNLIPERGYKS